METTRTKAPFDRRVRRTRAAIKESFLSLSREKGADQITVKEVMSLANVNRATFYAHFANLDELAAAIESDVAGAIAARCEEALARTLTTTVPEACTILCDALLEDRESLAWIAGPKATGCGREQLRELARAHWEQVACPGSDGLVFDLLFDGCIGLAGQWCEDPESLTKDEVKAAICSAAEKLTV
ncbi:TetR/AcrR family transcriptional regulator [Paratractidigestivibacter sp.]|uniref:TetR/AcrR family transcriptional regulator n=1 Tax=Paratractidigestivibacter sp. TaxID=2847316 RepID=UPI002ACB18F9|nr:TetR/AcrR family transcriptional regulator [Paratractidigestivibacter sp.]